MSKFLQIIGLEPKPAVKAAYAESREAFQRQLDTTCVTEASQVNKVAVKQLRRALGRATSLTIEIDRDLSGRNRDGRGHAD
jgi:hypothetical protein